MIDDHRVQTWPAEVRAKLRRTEQGCVLPGDIPLGYYAERSTATSVGATHLTENGLQFVEIEGPEGWIIRTQSCDIAEEHRARPFHPFLTVSPVYQHPNAGPVTDFEITNIGLSYQIRLTGPAFRDGYYIADLRYTQSVDKGLVVGRDLRKGFATADDGRRFAAHLAMQPSRAAFDADVDDLIVDSIRKYFRKREPLRARAAAAGLRELRLAIAHSNPRVAQLFFIFEDPSRYEDVREVLGDWYYQAKARCEASGILLLEPRFETLDNLSARQYVTSQRLLIEWIVTTPLPPGGSGAA